MPFVSLHIKPYPGGFQNIPPAIVLCYHDGVYDSGLLRPLIQRRITDTWLAQRECTEEERDAEGSKYRYNFMQYVSWQRFLNDERKWTTDEKWFAKIAEIRKAYPKFETPEIEEDFTINPNQYTQINTQITTPMSNTLIEKVETLNETEIQSLAAAKFGKALEVLTKLSEEANTVTVVNNDQLSEVAKNYLERLRNARLKINNKIKEVDAPYASMSKAIRATGNQMLVLITPVEEQLKSLQVNWLNQKERERLAKLEEQKKAELAIAKEKLALQEKLTELGNKLKEYGTNALVDITSCETDEQLKNMFAKYVKGFPGEDVWQEVNTEALNVLELIRKTGRIQRNIILYEIQLSSATADQKVEIETNLATQKNAIGDVFRQYNVEVKKQLNSIDDKIQEKSNEFTEETALIIDEKIDNSKQTEGLRKTWAYEVVDMAAVPDEWKVVSLYKTQIDEYLKNNKKKLQDGEIINGIKFYQKTGLSGR